jgi:uncharacterized circularly permuted ATP-grasp superfamily protein
LDYSGNGDAFDEVLGSWSNVSSVYDRVVRRFSELDSANLLKRERRIDASLQERGVTFDSDANPSEPAAETLTVDPFPRIISGSDWDDHLEPGLKQRTRALNLFLEDVYGDQKILQDDVLPPRLVLDNDSFRRRLHGMKPPGGVYTHIAGIDLIRDEEGAYRVLEDNLQLPSGVSYMLENRRILLETFPRLVNEYSLRSIGQYPDQLLRSLKPLAPSGVNDPTAVLLTPGPYNSAYFEHVFLARKMDIELVKGNDLYVDDGTVWIDFSDGRERVDVIYRRINTEYLDPAAFKTDSVLGIPGLMDAYELGNVVIANAPGAGIADDKALYSYVPDLIEYYLDQEPILPNVKTYLGRKEQDRQYILEHAEKLTIKRVDEAGGYGMLIGPRSTKSEIESYLEQFRESPQDYIAQPTINLSTHPCLVEETDSFEPRHIDLRPFVLMGQEGPELVPGGLTRVALDRGSLVVNSSQGGGSKDTWVLQ